MMSYLTMEGWSRGGSLQYFTNIGHLFLINVRAFYRSYICQTYLVTSAISLRLVLHYLLLLTGCFLPTEWLLGIPVTDKLDSLCCRSNLDKESPVAVRPIFLSIPLSDLSLSVAYEMEYSYTRGIHKAYV